MANKFVMWMRLLLSCRQHEGSKFKALKTFQDQQTACLTTEVLQHTSVWGIIYLFLLFIFQFT